MGNEHDASLMLEAAQALACVRSGLCWPETGVDLIVRLKARADVLGATKAVNASPTRQEPARAPITEPVRVVVRSDFGAPPGVEIESVMRVAGIPGRVCSNGIEVKFGEVEWECRPTGDVAITWYPAGR